MNLILDKVCMYNCVKIHPRKARSKTYIQKQVNRNYVSEKKLTIVMTADFI